MKRGKHICNTLKEIRKQIAKENNIEYNPRECTHKGDCLGTCPACVSERMYLEKELSLRKSMGKAVSIIGISAGLTALTSCSGNTATKTADSSSENPLKTETITDATNENPNDTLQVEEEEFTPTGIVIDFRDDESAIPQQSSYEFIEPINDSAITEEDDIILGMIDGEHASFPGESEEFVKFVKDNLKYPEQARKDSVQGRVYVTCVIQKDGTVTEVKVLRGIGSGCDEEAVRVVKSMPKFIPAKQGGKVVSEQYNIPITFKLD